MAKTDRAWLRHYIELIRSYRSGQHPSSLEGVFSGLTLLEVDSSDPLWGELRCALAQNDALTGKVCAFLADPHLAQEEGYWWYDPRAWTAQAEAAA